MADVVLSHQAERSVLHDPRRAHLVAFTVGGRPRLATCSGVAWFRGYHLAVVNLYGGHLRTYRFHPGDGPEAGAPRLELLHEMSRGLCCPEDVAVSSDGNLVAVTHSLSEDLGVTLHRLDPVSCEPDPAGINLREGQLGSAFHGVRFSPDSRYLAFTRISDPGHVEVVRVGATPGVRACLLENRRAPLRPKGVAFTPDGRFVAIAKGPIGRLNGPSTSEGSVSIHRFDAVQGVIDPDPYAQHDLAEAYLDLAAFVPSTSGTRYTLLVSDQAADGVRRFELDTERGTFGYAGVFATGLSFPHGVDVSADGRFVAITNYGDDTVRIARLR